MANNGNNITHIGGEAEIENKEPNNPLFQAAKKVSATAVLLLSVASTNALAKENSYIEESGSGISTASATTPDMTSIEYNNLLKKHSGASENTNSGNVNPESENQNGENGEIDVSRLSPQEAHNVLNHNNSIINTNQTVFLYPNNIAYNVKGNTAYLDIDMSTKNGNKPLNYAEFPLSEIATRLAVGEDNISYEVNNSDLGGASLEIENGLLKINGNPEQNKSVTIKLYTEKNGKKTSLGQIELYIKKAINYTHNESISNEPISLDDEASNSAIVASRDITNGEQGGYIDTVHGAFVLNGEVSDGANLNSALLYNGIDPSLIIEASSYSDNYKVVLDAGQFSLVAKTGINPKVKTAIREDFDKKTKSETYVNNSAYAYSGKTTIELVPIELTLNDGTTTIINLRVKKLPALELSSNQKIIDASIKNADGETFTSEGIEIQHKGDKYEVLIDINTLTGAKPNTASVYTRGEETIINEFNNIKVEGSFEGCEDLKIINIAQNGEPSDYRLTMTCGGSLEEGTTQSFSGELQLSSTVAPENGKSIFQVSLNITPENQDNSLKITPSSENPGSTITDPGDTVTLKYDVEGDFQIDEDSLPEGFSCSKGEGNNIKIEIDYIPILENNQRGDYSIEGLCVLESANNPNRKTTINISEVFYFTPAIEEYYALGEVALNSTTSHNFTSKNNSPFALKRRLEPGHSLIVGNEAVGYTTYTSEYEGNIIIPANSNVKIIIDNLGDTPGENTIEYKGLVRISYEVIDADRSSFESFDTLEEICGEHQNCTFGPIGEITYFDGVTPTESFNLIAKDAQGNTFNVNKYFETRQEVVKRPDGTHTGTLSIKSKGDILPSSMIDGAKENLGLYVSFTTEDGLNYDSNTPAVNLTLYGEEERAPSVKEQSATILGQAINSVEAGQEHTALVQMTSGLNPNNPNLNIGDLLKGIKLVNPFSTTQEIGEITGYEIDSQDNSKIRVTFKVTNEDPLLRVGAIQVETNDAAFEIDAVPDNQKEISFSSAFFGILR